MPKGPEGEPRGDQRWSTFLKNHARAILACDFFVAVTATFRLLYVFVVIEHGRRWLAHVGVTNHPTADWTLQQLREVVGDEGAHRYCAVGSWGGQRLSMGGYVTGPGARGGPPLPEGVDVDYPHPLPRSSTGARRPGARPR
jgi:hypothetical protein